MISCSVYYHKSMKNEADSVEKFKNRVHHYANKIGVEVKTLAMRPMKNKWASCSTNGNLNFNVELISAEAEVGDYVIIHELLHFKAPNHSKLWKSLMRVYLGDYEKIEQKLKMQSDE